MTAYQLRKHLAGTHDLPLRGLPYETLMMVHEHEHLAGQDHEHDHDGEGDG